MLHRTWGQCLIFSKLHAKRSDSSRQVSLVFNAAVHGLFVCNHWLWVKTPSGRHTKAVVSISQFLRLKTPKAIRPLLEAPLFLTPPCPLLLPLRVRAALRRNRRLSSSWSVQKQCDIPSFCENHESASWSILKIWSKSACFNRYNCATSYLYLSSCNQAMAK